MKKQTEERGIIQRNTVFNRSDQQLSPTEAEDLVTTWFKNPPTALSNMFYTFSQEAGIHHNLRAITYELPAAGLQDLVAKYDAIDKEKTLPLLKVYLGCNKDYKASEINMDRPAFTPFVQLNLSGLNPTEGFENCYGLSFRKKSTIPIGSRNYPYPINDPTDFSEPTKIENSSTVLQTDGALTDSNLSRISPESAHLFVAEWSQIDDSEIHDSFIGQINGQSARLNSISFLKEDLEIIAELSRANPKRSLFVHLGIIRQRIQSPFTFHIILEVAELSSTNLMPLGEAGGSTFFEFGYPCPPYCKGLGGG